MVTLLLDGDIIAYQASCAAEQEICWGNDLWTRHADLKQAQSKYRKKIEKITDHFKTNKLIFTFSHKENFRKDLCHTYKQNRKNVKKPIVYNALKQWIKENHKVYEKRYLEGDDVLGILATHKDLVSGKKLILSDDKDMATIPGQFAKLSDFKIQNVSLTEANKAHMIQTLSGDRVDGYPGCPGIGQQRATKLLEDVKDCSYEELWPLVLNEFLKKGLNETDAILQAQLARILRSEDYDFNKKRPKHWKP